MQHKAYIVKGTDTTTDSDGYKDLIRCPFDDVTQVIALIQTGNDVHENQFMKESFTTRAQEGFDPSKDKYKKGMYAIVDDRRRAFAIPPPILTQTVSEEMGPHLPKNPYRR